MLIGAVVRVKASGQVIGVADVKPTLGILKNVDPEHTPKRNKLAPERLKPLTRPVNPDHSGLY